MATPDPILDLTTQAPQVRIDGALYNLRVRDDLTILQDTEIAKKFEQLDALRAKPKRTAAEAKDQARLADELCRVVLDAPPAVHAKLSGFQRMGIVTSFFEGLLAATGPAPTPSGKAKSKKSTSAS